MKVKLAEIGTIITGNTPKTSDAHNYFTKDICFVKPSDISGSEITYIADSEFHISDYARAKARVVPTGSILVTCIGIIGKIAINKVECSFNQQINCIIPDTRKVIPDYLAYSLQAKQGEMQSIANAAVVPIINKTLFSEIVVRLPSITDQCAIVEKMGTISHLISLRKQQLAKLDEMVKSRFVEMFGDPVSNPHGYPKVPLSELAEIKIGPFGSLLHKEDYIANGHALINPSHIVDGKIFIDNELSVSDEKFSELSAYRLQIGDVVMGRRGEMGRCAVVHTDGLLCGTGSLLIRTKGDVTADYLQKIISFPSFKKTIEGMAVGQTMPNLNVPIVSEFQIIKPPIEVQKAYYTFVEQTDKSKLAIQQSLDKLETLKKALIQKYFG